MLIAHTPASCTCTLCTAPATWLWFTIFLLHVRHSSGAFFTFVSRPPLCGHLHLCQTCQWTPGRCGSMQLHQFIASVQCTASPYHQSEVVFAEERICCTPMQEQAVQYFNLLNQEQRSVMAALFPEEPEQASTS